MLSKKGEEACGCLQALVYCPCSVVCDRSLRTFIQVSEGSVSVSGPSTGVFVICLGENAEDPKHLVSGGPGVFTGVDTVKDRSGVLFDFMLRIP